MSADPKEAELGQDAAPLLDHLTELRNRLLYSVAFLGICFGVCYHFAPQIYQFLVAPLADIFPEQEGRRLIFTGLTEAFFSYIKVAFYASLFIAFPVIACQIYIFLAPGLYKNERRVLLPYLFLCPILFAAGAAMVYYFVFPVAWKFFISFENAELAGQLPIVLEARVGEYLQLVIQLIFAFGIAFQLPLVLTLLARVGLLTSQGLASKRKFAIVFIAIGAAILTPPDVISQIGLALPLLLLYECSIIAIKCIEKGSHHA